jgi:sterol desaturase/sphingolipid hydroxylase (fatty acid hydroxylase superfamily)
LDDAVTLLGHAGPKVAAGIFLLLLAVETLYPLRRRKRERAGRYVVNFVLTAAAFAVGTFVVRRTALLLAYSGESSGFGLLRLFDMPFGARLVAGFLLMDLTFYYWHRANHEVGLLWRFHNVHHVDQDLDVTTSFRFHFVEVLYSTGFRAAQVWLLGVSPLTYAAYELVFTCETAFHHSNLRLPVGVERLINKVIVTPRMHGIHHSAVKDETNSNYSVVFRWWDALHGTLRLGVRQSDITIGVPAYQGLEDNRVLGLAALPFADQRDYWRFPNGYESLTRGPEGAGRQRSLMLE